MRDVYIAGVGMTKFGKFPETPFYALGRQAVIEALKDANVNYKAVQAGYCSNQFALTAGQKVFKELGMSGMPIHNVSNACASGATALNLAYWAVRSGQYDLVVAVACETLSDRGSGTPLAPGMDDIEGYHGSVMPAMYAMRARKYLEMYDATIEDLAMIAVKNHKHASMNPYAQYRNIITVDDVMNARKIADPFTLLHCCPQGDGAAAAVICSEDMLKRLGAKGVKIAASVINSGKFTCQPKDITKPDITIRASKDAYEMAGIGPEDVAIVECHDAFTIAEMLYYEALGFCKWGDGAAFLRSGATALGGKHVFSIRGGLICMGHPIGASGIAQAVELVWQLRGEAGDRQVQGAKVAMAHITGGGVSGMDNAACGVHIFTV